jgi:hypothetical protein
MYVTNKIIQKQSFKKTLVDNKYIDRFTDGQSMPKEKFTRFIPSVNIIYH